MSLVLPQDFAQRWTRARLGLAPDADLAFELEGAIERAVDHVRDTIGATSFDAIANADPTDDRRKRLQRALRRLVEARLHQLETEALGHRVGSSTQGRRSRTISKDAVVSARRGGERAFSDYVSDMFALGFTVRSQATNVHYTRIER